MAWQKKQQRYNVNKVSKEDLMKIPGVGEKTAEAIIQFRDEHGKIDDISELTGAEQLDRREIEDLKEWLTV